MAAVAAEGVTLQDDGGAVVVGEEVVVMAVAVVSSYFCGFFYELVRSSMTDL